MKKMRVTVNGVAYEVEVELLEDTDDPFRNGLPMAPPAPTPQTAKPEKATASVASGVNRPPSQNAKELTSPIAGSIQEIKVKAGDQVAENDLLMVIEAMKMNTHICSPVSGRIAEIPVTAGSGVTQGQVLVTFA